MCGRSTVGASAKSSSLLSECAAQSKFMAGDGECTPVCGWARVYCSVPEWGNYSPGASRWWMDQAARKAKPRFWGIRSSACGARTVVSFLIYEVVGPAARYAHFIDVEENRMMKVSIDNRMITYAAPDWLCGIQFSSFNVSFDSFKGAPKKSFNKMA